MVDLNSNPLFWVPPQLRSGLLGGGVLLVIGPQPKAKLDLSLFVYGTSWTLCERDAKAGTAPS